jgi:hypothetical protein
MTQGRAEHAHRVVTMLRPRTVAWPPLRAGALGVAGPRPRASVLHGECTGHPKDGGSSPDRGGDIEAEEELRLGGAQTTTVASGGSRRSAMHPVGQREREVSEGHGLGEERLEGWLTEER